jgi:hypothetical protein
MSKTLILIKELSTLQYHDVLNPVLWDNSNQLRPDVRSKLLQFAYRFADYSYVPQDRIKDIVMTGGNANYNYTPTSDIDVHLIVDTNKLGFGSNFQDYLMSKKSTWMAMHDPRIKGYPLEPYVQDVNEKIPTNQADYSLKYGKWNTPPVHGNFDWANDPLLDKKVQGLKTQIDQVTCKDCDLNVALTLWKRIANLRGTSIAASGEFALENLVFKELRNSGYLDKITNFINKEMDLQLSL